MATNSPAKSERFPVFSDFSHMGGYSSIFFAVGLRDSENQASEIAEKVLPMSKIVPGKEIQKHHRKSINTTGPCERPECVLRRSQLIETRTANDPLKSQVADLEAQMRSIENKTASTIKATSELGDRNVQFMQQLEDLRGGINTLEMESDKREFDNKKLRDAYDQLKVSTDGLNREVTCKLSELDKLRHNHDIHHLIQF